MILYTEYNEQVDLADYKLLHTKGKHCSVYYNKSSACKVFKEDFRSKYLQNIKCVYSAIKTLEDLEFWLSVNMFLYNENGEINAYTTRFINGNKCYLDILDMEEKKFLYAISLILKEVEYFNELGILLDDVLYSDTDDARVNEVLVDDLFHLSDYSCYERCLDKNYVRAFNNRVIDNLVLDILFKNPMCSMFTKEFESEKAKSLGYKNYLQYLLDNFKSKTPRDYVLSLTRN